jgi:hypothetical protein
MARTEAGPGELGDEESTGSSSILTEMGGADESLRSGAGTMTAAGLWDSSLVMAGRDDGDDGGVEAVATGIGDDRRGGDDSGGVVEATAACASRGATGAPSMSGVTARRSLSVV